MPSITTHHFFAQEVFNHLRKEDQNHIKDELIIYSTFAQSHDYLFYYTFDFKNNKIIRELGHYAHHHNTQAYLLNIVKYIKDNHLEDNQQVVAYLYGSVTHYCLDSTCHPYIFYKTGVARKNKKETYKYRGEHNHMEKDLDAIIYKRYTNKNYNHCNLNRDIIKNPHFNQELCQAISFAYNETYQIPDIAKYYQKSIKDTKIINALVINDYLGIKRLLYKLIDFITHHRFGYIQAYSTHILHPDLSYLNNEHKKWNHPAFKERTYTYSFDDLYEESLKKSVNIIQKINEVLYEDKSIDYLKEYIPDLDYATGVKISESRRMDYFEY